MRKSTKIVGWLIILLGWTPSIINVIRDTINEGSVQSPPTGYGAWLWCFGIGGIGLILQKSWGWWLAAIGLLLLLIGSMGLIFLQSFTLLNGLIVFISLLLFVGLILDPPHKWMKCRINNESGIVEKGDINITNNN